MRDLNEETPVTSPGKSCIYSLAWRSRTLCHKDYVYGLSSEVRGFCPWWATVTDDWGNGETCFNLTEERLLLPLFFQHLVVRFFPPLNMGIRSKIFAFKHRLFLKV